MSDSIFTKLIKGEIPSHKIYEDDKTFAFLDIHPIQPGHVLIVPKRQVESVWDLTDEDYQALMATAKLVAKQLRQVFPEKSRVAMLIEGLDVAHAHLKLFPFNTDSEFRNVPDMTVEPDFEQLAAVAKRLAF
jgi:histidine triad (HIT) family protein